MAEDLDAVLLRVSTAMAICLFGEDNFETCPLLTSYHNSLLNIP